DPGEDPLGLDLDLGDDGHEAHDDADGHEDQGRRDAGLGRERVHDDDRDDRDRAHDDEREDLLLGEAERELHRHLRLARRRAPGAARGDGTTLTACRPGRARRRRRTTTSATRAATTLVVPDGSPSGTAVNRPHVERCMSRTLDTMSVLLYRRDVSNL